MAMQFAVTVATSATALMEGNDERQTGRGGIVYVTNLDVNDIFVGDAQVTTGTGTPISPGEMMPFRAVGGQDLYAISAGGSAPVRVQIR